MKFNIRFFALSILLVLLGFFIGWITKSLNDEKERSYTKKEDMEIVDKNEESSLGAFSISLSVKDLERSRQFYEEVGFNVFAGDLSSNYLIMKRGNALIGLFQGMFEGNLLTFNPGWDENARNLEVFEDVRSIQKRLKLSGVILESEADEDGTGPASFMVKDPDGNVILFDQHREKK